MNAALRAASRSMSEVDLTGPAARWNPFMAVVAFGFLGSSFAAAQVAPNAFELIDESAEAEAAEPVEPGMSLPSDRGRERQLDRARRLVAGERWSDAAAALDELLADERDAFVSGGLAATQGSIRSEALALIQGLPRPGREAYQLLFRGRAEARLAAAIAADDPAGIIAVARRWLHTPAGRQAALIAAIESLEAGRPADASAWLDRLAGLPDADDFEPTLAVLRSIARRASGDEAEAGRLLAAAARGGRSRIRLGGRDVSLPTAADAAATVAWLAEHAGGVAEPPATRRDWRQFRGTPSRAGLGDASRPLLVPRYRVPLVRHPEEGRRLERRRREAADQGRPLTPAGTPLAVGEKIVVQTPLGILAIDFESGRRVWLASAVAMAEADANEAEGGSARVFDDATSGMLASDGRLVFAVESPPAALTDARDATAGFGPAWGVAQDWATGNTLSAYDLASGDVRWQLPDGRADAAEEPSGVRWHLGPPLVAGDDLFLLVEEDGEVLVEVRSASSGSLRWSQPLATPDEQDAITALGGSRRRRAGLTPALDGGVLVCPIGGGCVVAIDVATRSLLWVHAYPRPTDARDAGRLRRELGRVPDGESEAAGVGEPAPIIAAGRVIIAPFDADTISCLDLRDGSLRWRQPRGDTLAVAGVTADRLLLVAVRHAEAVDLATGKRLWKRDFEEGVQPSGRGILTAASLLLPCDAPAVLEIAVADGRVVGRSPARDGQLPGSLIAHRGEVVSRGLESLDVFHQEAALETRIETALREDSASPWAAYWRGQLAIDGGDVEAGFDALARAATGTGFRLPPGTLAAAVERAMERDFAVAARRWAAAPDSPSAWTSPAVLRVAVDGFLAAGDQAAAWPLLRQLLDRELELDATGIAGPRAPVSDSADRRLSITASRWLRSRLTRLLAHGDAAMRRQVDDACERLVDVALAAADPLGRQVQLESLHRILASHPAADRLRRAVATIDAGNDRRTAVRHQLLALESPEPAAVEAGSPAGGDVDLAHPWPLGQVEHRERRADAEATQVIPLPLIGGGPQTRAARAALDLSREKLLVSDEFGRPVTAPLPVAGIPAGFGLPFINQTAAVEVAALGRVAFVRSAAGIAAYDLDGPPGGRRGLWQRSDLGTIPGDGARWAGGVGGRVARDGAVPLGMRIDEPFDRPRGGGRGMMALPIGLLVPGPRSLTVLDPGTGELLWERHLLPAGLEWLADGEFLCGCTVDGRGSLVLASVDGSLVQAVDLPHRRQRVTSRGRRLVTVTAIDDRSLAGVAGRVRLDFIDPVDRETRLLGEFDGRARAADTGDGRLAVLEPDGRLTTFDLVDGGVMFSRLLDHPPRVFERLHVQVWQDRYLVFAGGRGDDETSNVSPLEQLMLTAGSAPPLSGSVWAVDRLDGRPLWPGPALIEQHCLHTAQPAGLPVLAFCRLVETRGRSREALSVLLLDKRTGHAVFAEDRIEVKAHTGQCELVGDPDDHTVTIGGFDAARGSLVLTFTGRPMAPRPPFQARGRGFDTAPRLPAALGGGARPGGIDGLERLLVPDDPPLVPLVPEANR
jgi:outer membrane protein assembly factor BamB